MKYPLNRAEIEVDVGEPSGTWQGVHSPLAGPPSLRRHAPVREGQSLPRTALGRIASPEGLDQDAAGRIASPARVRVPSGWGRGTGGGASPHRGARVP